MGGWGGCWCTAVLRPTAAQPHSSASPALPIQSHLQRGLKGALVAGRARLQHLFARLRILRSPEVRGVLCRWQEREGQQ